MTVTYNPNAVKPSLKMLRQSVGSALVGYSTGTVADRLDSLGQVGTRGQALARLDGANVWSGAQTFEVPPVFTDAAGTRDALGIVDPSSNYVQLAANNVITGQTQTQLFTSDGATGPVYTFFLNTTTPAAGDILGQINFKTSFVYARIEGTISDPTSTSEDGQINFKTAVAGAAASTRFSIINGLVGTGATGGDKGSGTGNFTAVYDDNTLLTDYVFDMALDGRLSDADADNGRAQAFDASVLDVDTFAQKWKERRALPSMPLRAEWTEESRPSVGDLLQRLWETVEVQAVHMEKLNERIKAMEAK